MRTGEVIDVHVADLFAAQIQLVHEEVGHWSNQLDSSCSDRKPSHFSAPHVLLQPCTKRHDIRLQDTANKRLAKSAATCSFGQPDDVQLTQYRQSFRRD